MKHLRVVSLIIVVAIFLVTSVGGVSPALAQTQQNECWVEDITTVQDYFGTNRDGALNRSPLLGNIDPIYGAADEDSNIIGKFYSNEVREILDVQSNGWTQITCIEQEGGPSANTGNNPLDGETFLSTDGAQKYRWDGGRLHWDNIPSGTKPAHSVVITVPGLTVLTFNGRDSSLSNAETGLLRTEEQNGQQFQFTQETELLVLSAESPIGGFEIVTADWSSPFSNEMVGRRWYSDQGIRFSMIVGGDEGYWWWMDKLSASGDHIVSGWILPGEYEGDFIDGTLTIGSHTYGPGNGVTFRVSGSNPVVFIFESESGGSFWRTDVR